MKEHRFRDMPEKPVCPEDTDFGIYCIDGTVYGFCSSELCYGGCEPEGSCPVHGRSTNDPR